MPNLSIKGDAHASKIVLLHCLHVSFAAGFFLLHRARELSALFCVDLGTLGGSLSWGWAVNNSGQVTGSSHTSAGVEHAFFWSNGTMTDIDPLGGQSEPGDINELDRSRAILGLGS